VGKAKRDTVESATAYSEDTDPIEQRRLLTAQSLKAAAGIPEATQLDEDFVQALETGSPPTGDLGIGVDRLVMIITDSPIRSALTFPFVRRPGLLAVPARCACPRGG